MSWDAISALAEVAGAVATVATLAFLAVQIRDNTAAVRASVFNQKTDSWADAMRPLLDPGHTELFLSGLRSYQALGAADKLRFGVLVGAMLDQLSGLIEHQQRGLIAESALAPYDAYFAELFRWAGAREFWEVQRPMYSGAVRARVERALASRSGVAA
jgi:hypothetical protein